MPKEGSDLPDRPMTTEEQAVADALSSDVVRKIDQALLSYARPQERKVAMLVGLAMTESALSIPGLPDIYYAQRVRALVESGALLVNGSLDRMRHSEVRLPGVQP